MFNREFLCQMVPQKFHKNISFFRAFSDTILLLSMHCIRRKIINVYIHLLVTGVRQKINRVTFPIEMIDFSC